MYHMFADNLLCCAAVESNSTKQVWLDLFRNLIYNYKKLKKNLCSFIGKKIERGCGKDSIFSDTF